MKVLNIVLIACSLSAAAAHAQTAQVSPQQQVSQTNVRQADDVAPPSRAVAPASTAEECVGPMSFCNIYFGS
ncbi:hypothetical protein VOM14_24665 [Paraburkholderia sp. MPAMCS5]|nr:hypothetical protein [Paraburkholderia sp. MPAMCS5]